MGRSFRVKTPASDEIDSRRGAASNTHFWFEPSVPFAAVAETLA
jgi:hypothetical protein